MPRYHKMGRIPHKRHTVFRKENGDLYYEELFGTIGFDGMSSLLYHEQRPTQVKRIVKSEDVSPKITEEFNMKALSLNGFGLKPESDFLDSRKIVMTNNDLHISLAAPKHSTTEYFYKNTDSDEVIFVHKGTGTLKTHLGNIPFEYGDYLLIPRGTIYQMHFDKRTTACLLWNPNIQFIPQSDIEIGLDNIWSTLLFVKETCFLQVS
jgi:homogentisate 1,2-dioxygenase